MRSMERSPSHVHGSAIRLAESSRRVGARGSLCIRCAGDTRSTPLVLLCQIGENHRVSGLIGNKRGLNRQRFPLKPSPEKKTTCNTLFGNGLRHQSRPSYCTLSLPECCKPNQFQGLHCERFALDSHRITNKSLMILRKSQNDSSYEFHGLMFGVCQASGFFAK